MKSLRLISNGVLMVRFKNAVIKERGGHKPKVQIELLNAY